MKKVLAFVFSFLLPAVALADVHVQGSAGVANGAVDSCVISTPSVAGRAIWVTDIHVWVSTAAAGGGGEVALEMGVGGTRFWEADADAVGTHDLHFAKPGFKITDDVCLNVTVDGAATTQATAGANAAGWTY